MGAFARPGVRGSCSHRWSAPASVQPQRANVANRSASRSRAHGLRDAGEVAHDGDVAAVDKGDRAIMNEATATALSVAEACSETDSVSEESSPWACHVTEDSQFFDWKYNSKLHYVHQGAAGPSVLLVHGFGVGSYQFEENMRDLSSEHSVWAIDLLGQGCSWPRRQPQASDNLQYSLDTWTEQLADFVREVIREPVYVAGNSLGGLLSVSLAAQHPELVQGVILLNAAPFWSFAPRPGTLLARFMPYDGTVPAPDSIKEVIGKYWFSRLSDPGTIQELIKQVYCTNSMIDAEFLERIVASTKHPEALEAFASIMFSPAGSMSFSEMASRIEAPMCLIYGRDDPWIVPLWGQRLKRLVPSIDYFELSPAGHCPHHEAPVTVDTVMRDWIGAKRTGAELSLAIGETMTQSEEDGRRITVTHTSGLPRNVFEHLDYNLWRLRTAFSKWRNKEGQEAASI